MISINLDRILINFDQILINLNQIFIKFYQKINFYSILITLLPWTQPYFMIKINKTIKSSN